jgi:hypothetical protein
MSCAALAVVMAPTATAAATQARAAVQGVESVAANGLSEPVFKSGAALDRPADPPISPHPHRHRDSPRLRARAGARRGN